MPNYPNGLSPYEGQPKPKEENMQYFNPEDEKYKMKDYHTLPIKEQLQRSAREVHDDFVATTIERMEKTARNGYFSICAIGTPEEIEAMAIYCRENNLAYDCKYLIGSTTEIIIRWNE